MSAMTEPALFPEPERTPPRTDGPWLIAPAPGGWRYMFLGEDGRWLMIEGHLRDEEALTVLDHAGFADFERIGQLLIHTWARKLKCCPNHEKPDDTCEFCQWDWSTPPGEPSDANRSKRDYFPATVVDLEA